MVHPVTTTPWYDETPARWQNEQALAKEFMNDVQAGLDQEGKAYLTGTFRVLSEHGHEYGAFRLRIVYPAGFPRRKLVPAVYLDSHRGRWKNCADAHIESDWKLCFCVPGESEIDFAREDSLKQLFACLRTFLLKEWLYQRDLIRQELTGKPAEWPGDARPHGIEGVREVVKERRLGRNSLCPCGSGKKFKKCCMTKFFTG